MKKYTLQSAMTLLFFIVLGCLAVGLPSCGDVEEPLVTDEQQLDDVINGYATDQISHTHRIGIDPCPQVVVPKIKVYCYKSQDQSNCDADSVVITNPTFGLTATIGGQMSSALPDETGNLNIDLTFTCSIAESFKHTYTLVFYKEGVEVDREDAVVNVTVI